MEQGSDRQPKRGIQFPYGPTCTPDGVHPRHFALLSEQGLVILSHMLWIIDALGNFPRAQQSLIISLYSKPNPAGVRPIGFFRALFRLWGKLKKGG